MIKSSHIRIVSIVLIILLIVADVSVYFWQHGMVNSSQRQVSSLKTNLRSTTISLQKQSSSLSMELNKANEAIRGLSKSNTFVAGATCQDAQLQLSWEQRLSGGFGGGGAVFSYQNISNSPCTLEGYPGFLALDNTGRVKPNGPIATGYDSSKLKPALLTINPNGKVYFVVVGWSNMMAAGPCFNTSLIESTPPGNTIPLVTTASIQMCDTGPGPVSALTTLQGLNSVGIKID